MCCCSANGKLFSICLPFIIFLQLKGSATMCVLSAMLTLLRSCFSVLCVCIYIIPIIVITIYYTIDCCLLCQSWWHFSPLIGVVTCSHEHLCVVAVPTASCFQYVCRLSYFCSFRVLQLVAATMCVLSAMLTLLRFCFSVLCVCIYIIPIIVITIYYTIDCCL